MKRNIPICGWRTQRMPIENEIDMNGRIGFGNRVVTVYIYIYMIFLVYIISVYTFQYEMIHNGCFLIWQLKYHCPSDHLHNERWCKLRITYTNIGHSHQNVPWVLQPKSVSTFCRLHEHFKLKIKCSHFCNFCRQNYSWVLCKMWKQSRKRNACYAQPRFYDIQFYDGF